MTATQLAWSFWVYAIKRTEVEDGALPRATIWTVPLCSPTWAAPLLGNITEACVHLKPLKDNLLSGNSFWGPKSGNLVFIRCWPWGNNVGVTGFKPFFYCPPESWGMRDAATVEMLVLTAISRRTGDCLCVLKQVTHIQTGEGFPRRAAQGSDLREELDWVHIFHPLAFRRSESVSDVPETGWQVLRHERIFFFKFLQHLRLSRILVVWIYIPVSLTRWGSQHNVSKWKFFRLWNAISYGATKDAGRPLYWI